MLSILQSAWGTSILCVLTGERANHVEMAVSACLSFLIKTLCFIINIFIFLNNLFLERQERRGKERETLIRCLSHTSNWGPGLHLRHVP